MNELNVIDKLKPGSFREKEEDEIVIEAAVFLTYSIDCKSILSALIAMLVEDSGEEDIVACWKKCLHNGMSGKASQMEAFREIQEHVAFVCNDGYDKSMSTPVYLYTREFTYYYRWDAEKHSFHPKLYIVRYRKNGELFFRFMVGSMNLVHSKNKEFIVTMDARAYEEEPENGSFVPCAIVNQLLGLDAKYCSANIRNNKERLAVVVKNLGLDICWMEKSVVNRLLAFPMQDINAPLPAADIVISPFLSKSLVNRLGKNVRLYTMESELRKIGYVAKEEGTAIAAGEREFYIYSVPEGEKAFNHIKMYVNETHVYAGSANFTGSALGIREKQGKQSVSYDIGKNKEILLRLDFDKKSTFRNNLEAYLKDAYVKRVFVYHKEAEKEADPADEFRALAEEIASCLQMKLEKADAGWNCELQLVNAKADAVREWERRADKLLKGSRIKLAPFRCKTEAKTLDSLSWTIANRMKLDDAFVLGLYSADKLKYSFTYHIDLVDETETKQKNGLNDVMQLTLLRLETLLDGKAVNSSTITKEMEEIEKSLIRKDIIGYVRRSIPTLEILLKNNLQKDRLQQDVIEQQMKRLALIQDVLMGSDKLTDEEKKSIGIDSMNKKVVDNMLEQGKALMKELGEDIHGV